MNVSDIKHSNKSNIYFYLREKGVATKQNIAYDLGLSLPTVSRNLESLVEKHLLRSDTKLESKTGGRNPIAYSYIPDAKVAIGLDITRNHIKSVVADLHGNTLYYKNMKMAFDRGDAYMRMLGDIVEETVEQAKLDTDKILGVAIAVPGLVSYDGRYVIYGRVIENEGMDCDTFSKYIPYETKLIHDSSAMGFAENWMSPDLEHAFYISLCNSVGGCVLLNSSLYTGDGIYSGEIGHLNLVPSGDTCYCGQKGCLDVYCSAERLSCHTDGDLDAFFAQIENEGSGLWDVWDQYLENLAVAITDVRMLFGCKIIIGGYVGTYIKQYMDILCSKVDAKSPFSEKSKEYLFPCKTRLESAAVGASLFFINDFLELLREQKREQNTPKIAAPRII